MATLNFDHLPDAAPKAKQPNSQPAVSSGLTNAALSPMQVGKLSFDHLPDARKEAGYGEVISKSVENAPTGAVGGFAGVGRGILESGDPNNFLANIVQDAQGGDSGTGLFDNTQLFDALQFGATYLPTMAANAIFDKPAENLAMVQQEAARQVQENQPYIEPDSDFKNMVASAAQSIPQQAPGILAAYLTKNPEFALVPGMLQSAGQEYGEQVAAGQNPYEAGLPSAVSGVAERIGEKLPLTELLEQPAKAGIKGAATKVAKVAVKDAIGESVTQAIQSANKKATIEPNLTLDEAIQRQIIAAGAGALGSGVTTLPIAAFEARQASKGEQPPPEGQTTQNMGSDAQQQRIEPTFGEQPAPPPPPAGAAEIPVALNRSDLADAINNDAPLPENKTISVSDLEIDPILREQGFAVGAQIQQVDENGEVLSGTLAAAQQNDGQLEVTIVDEQGQLRTLFAENGEISIATPAPQTVQPIQTPEIISPIVVEPQQLAEMPIAEQPILPQENKEITVEEMSFEQLTASLDNVKRMGKQNGWTKTTTTRARKLQEQLKARFPEMEKSFADTNLSEMGGNGIVANTKNLSDTPQGFAASIQGDSLTNIPSDLPLSGSNFNSSDFESPENGTVINSENFANSGDIKSLFDKGFGSLNTPAKLRVLKSMFRSGNNSEVFNSIIMSIPVDVMNNLVGQQLSPNDPFHNGTVFINSLAANADLPVLADAITAAIRRPAFPIAEVFGKNALTFRANNIASTEITNKNNGHSTDTNQPNNGRQDKKPKPTPIDDARTATLQPFIEFAKKLGAPSTEAVNKFIQFVRDNRTIADNPAKEFFTEKYGTSGDIRMASRQFIADVYSGAYDGVKKTAPTPQVAEQPTQQPSEPVIATVENTPYVAPEPAPAQETARPETVEKPQETAPVQAETAQPTQTPQESPQPTQPQPEKVSQDALILAENAEDVLDINRNKTGWKSIETDNSIILINPISGERKTFKSANEKSGTEMIRARALAQSYAIDNPVVREQQDNNAEFIVQPIFKKPAEPKSDATDTNVGEIVAPAPKKAAPVAEEKPADKIEDFGEKLQGAKKDLWTMYDRSLSDALPTNLTEITLSKHFPEPNYDALIESGISVDVLATIKALRDQIPNKPRQPYKLARWAEQVRVLRELSHNMLQDGTFFERFKTKGEEVRQLSGYFDIVELYKALGYPAFTKAKGWKVRVSDISKKIDGEYQKFKNRWIASKDSYFGTDFDTKEEAVEHIRKELSGEKSTAPRTVKLDIYRITKTGEIVIGKKVAAGKFIDLKDGFANPKDARAYLNDNYDDLVALLERKKDVPPVRRSTNDPRIGEDYRDEAGKLSSFVESLIDRSNASADLISNALIAHSSGSKLPSFFDVPLESVPFSGATDGMDADLNKLPSYRLSIFAKFLSNLNNTDALTVKGFRNLDIPAQRAVQSAMLAIGHNLKVRNSVIKLVPVDVVNNLSKFKLSAEGLLNDKSMLKTFLAVDGDMPVGSLDAALSFVRAVAGVTAKVSFTDNITRVALKSDPAIQALEGDGVTRKFSSHDITPSDFAAKFSFSGVQFGNYVTQEQRRQDLNQAYDALLDLADIINIPSAAISLDGQLGLAFGARGSGGKNPAAAHYEQGSVVINLTKYNGAGSLGHEWFHAFDNYFGKKRGFDYLTNNPFSTFESQAVRQEVNEAFKGISTAINETNIKERSAKLDGARSKDYWSTGHEMSARSFEAYLVYKADQKGYSNDYLANIASQEGFEAMMGKGTYPYPTVSEMETIAPAFDKLFEVIQTKQTDKGIAMYSLGNRSADSLQSSLLKAAQNLKQEKGTGPQFLAMLQKTAGIKEEEIAWTGLDDFLTNKRGVTKQEVVDYLEKNQVRLEDVTLEGEGQIDENIVQIEYEQIDSDLKESGVKDKIAENLLEKWYSDPSRENWAKLSDRLDGFGIGHVEYQSLLTTDFSAQTKFDQYTLPGGENYRELLITLPERDKIVYTKENVIPLEKGDPAATDPKKFYYFRTPDNVLQISRERLRNEEYARDYIISQKQPEASAASNFKSGHFDQPNIVAHVRLNDRDINGQKTLFIEEIQSDFGQSLRKQRKEAEKSLNDRWGAILDRMKKDGILEVICP